MTEPSRNNAGTTRGRPFPPGNPGRPKGSRHKTTQAMQVLLDGEGEALTRKAIELALAGDAVALRLCLDRLLPTLRERPVAVELPPLTGPKDAVAASAALIAAVASGEIAPGKASSKSSLPLSLLAPHPRHDAHTTDTAAIGAWRQSILLLAAIELARLRFPTERPQYRPSSRPRSKSPPATLARLGEGRSPARASSGRPGGMKGNRYCGSAATDHHAHRHIRC
jgi:hypothetical protein